MPRRAQVYIALVLSAGGFVFAKQLLNIGPGATAFWLYLLATILTSGLKVQLPRVMATLSVNYLFILVGIVLFNLPQAMILGAIGTLTQCIWRPRVRPQAVQIAFSTSSITLAVMAGHAVFHGWLNHALGETNPLLLLITALVYFLVNSILVAVVIGFTERKLLRRTWHETCLWVMPYYLGGAYVAWLIVEISQRSAWSSAIVLFPLVFFIYSSYHAHLDRLQKDKNHAEELAGLHLRTIEALALAIEAKDATTHDHLQRVRVYAIGIGKEMGLSEAELDALRAAALLHDIGKLAVPEHIISKPGKLTQEEFEKMKIHPLVGAEILEEVKFPYPVAPIVKAHHEKWDGSGYPAGLAGEQIPIGARILSAVDCLDALAADRQYRRALPLDQAMEIVRKEAGKSFDPRVVDILGRRCVELEKMAQSAGHEKLKLSMDVKVERGLAPATGFAETTDSEEEPLAIILAAANQAARGNHMPVSDSQLSSIAAAAQEAQVLHEVTEDLENSLSLPEALALVGVRLKRLIPYDAIACYVKRADRLIPEYVGGDNLRLFTSLRIPIGQGLSGWVAENNRSILNGNPSVEAGYLNDPTKYSTLRSALAVPLSGENGVLGVLALYRADRDAFSKENLRILLAIAAKVALAMENAMNHGLLRETPMATDYLTNLPNAVSLFLALDTEVARARSESSQLAVVVCDLDGFRTVNDNHGRLAGNKLLRVVADGIRAHFAATDFVARLGGDEFAMLVPCFDPAIVEGKVEAMRRAVAAAGATTPEPSALSLSVGVAVYPLDGLDAELLLAEASRRMYQSKRLRRKGPSVAQYEPVAAESAQVAAAV